MNYAVSFSLNLDQRAGPGALQSRHDSKLRGCDLVALRVDDVAPTDTRLTVPTSARARRVGLFASN